MHAVRRVIPSIAASSLALVAAVVLASAAHGQEAEPTTVSVRALAKGAKLIGDVVGGARITITDVATGAVLASGVTEGSTGDTDRIMSPPRGPGATVFATPGAAEFRATLDLERPTEVEIVAEGPLGYEGIPARAAKRMVLAPGADLAGEGIVLELHGLIVEILGPGEEGVAGGSLDVRARVRMLCSCPTEPGGLWSVERVTARLLADGELVAEVPLQYAGEESVYAGTIELPGPGEYALEVVGADPREANFGVARRTLIAR